MKRLFFKKNKVLKNLKLSHKNFSQSYFSLKNSNLKKIILTSQFCFSKNMFGNLITDLCKNSLKTLIWSFKNPSIKRFFFNFVVCKIVLKYPQLACLEIFFKTFKSFKNWYFFKTEGTKNIFKTLKFSHRNYLKKS